jgi:hypothetical protein
LKEHLSEEKALADSIGRAVEREAELQSSHDKELPPPAFNQPELNRLEDNAIKLRDSQLLRQAQNAMTCDSGNTAQSLRKLSNRAVGRAEAAGLALRAITERVENFTNNRDFFPVLFKSFDAEEKTASLHDLRPRTLTDKVTDLFSDNNKLDLKRIDDALDQHYTDLLTEHSSVERFTASAKQIATMYEQQLNTLDQQNKPNLAQFTTKEIVQIEKFAAQQVDANIRSQLENVAHSALNSNSVQSFTSSAPTPGMSAAEVWAPDPQLQLHKDDHLGTARETLDGVIVNASAESVTTNESVVGAETETGSDLWAALL